MLFSHIFHRVDFWSRAGLSMNMREHPGSGDCRARVVSLSPEPALRGIILEDTCASDNLIIGQSPVRHSLLNPSEDCKLKLLWSSKRGSVG